jgi:hypothetical protein
MSDDSSGTNGNGLPGGCPMNDGLAHECPESRRCQGKTRAGQPCKRPACPGRKWCTLHGGRSPVGPAHGRWKHGRYSSYLPRGVAADYKRAIHDPKLLELDSEVALLTARIAGLLRELGEVEAPPWGQAVESLNSLVLAVRDGEGIDEALAAHAAVVRQGADAAANHEQLWDKIQKTIDLKGRTARLEWKRQMDLCVALPAVQVMTLVNGILAAVEDICTHKYGNKDVYRQICRAALFYLPPECRQAGNGVVIDNEPAASNP